MDIWHSTASVLQLIGLAFCAGIFFRIGQNVTTGYILIGIVFGPGGLKLIDAHLAEYLAELGVVLLLFSIGLEFSWKRFKEFGLISLVGGLLQVGLTMGLVVFGGRYFGLSLLASVVCGGAIALSSTAVVLRTLIDRSQVDSVAGRSAIAILLFQDVAVVLLLLLVGSLEANPDPMAIATKLGLAMGKSVGLVAALYLISRYLIPFLFPRTTVRGSKEHLVMFSLLVALGSAYGAHFIGLPPTLGAFLAGMMMGESYLAAQTKAYLIPIEAFFLTIFFTSIGMIADMGWALGHIGQILLVVCCLLLGKAVIAFLVILVFRRAVRVSFAAALALANIGEFAFVLAKPAMDKGILDENTFQLLISSAILSMILAPLIMRIPDLLPTRRRKERNEEEEGKPLSLKGHTVVVGYGPVGRKAVKTLENIGSVVVVIDLNPRLAAAGKTGDTQYLFGDSTSPELLHSAAIDTARALIVTLPDPKSTRLTIEQARDMAPDITILARARYSQSVSQLYEAGANHVVDEEESTGETLAMDLVVAAGLPPNCVEGGTSACSRELPLPQE